MGIKNQKISLIRGGVIHTPFSKSQIFPKYGGGLFFRGFLLNDPV